MKVQMPEIQLQTKAKKKCLGTKPTAHSARARDCAHFHMLIQFVSDSMDL